MVGEYAPQWKFRWFNAHKCKLIVIGTIWGGGGAGQLAEKRLRKGKLSST